MQAQCLRHWSAAPPYGTSRGHQQLRQGSGRARDMLCGACCILRAGRRTRLAKPVSRACSPKGHRVAAQALQEGRPQLRQRRAALSSREKGNGVFHWGANREQHLRASTWRPSLSRRATRNSGRAAAGSSCSRPWGLTWSPLRTWHASALQHPGGMHTASLAVGACPMQATYQTVADMHMRNVCMTCNLLLQQFCCYPPG